ncbi:Pentatricopeptide repeat [Melia azedarach]|uniref:Pentatricopeptide repeat n=2 Tax=Melia azedarach TaxID=155640 RepID=A0ACC1XLY0_MELAZ|nr:Pentatricopeptide repeat [Melia azedarach]
MIRAFTLKHSPQEAMILYKTMRENCVQPDHFTFACTLKACSRIRALKEGEQIHGHLLKSGFGLKELVWNSLIQMYANCGEIVIARKVFDGMYNRDVFSWNSMFSGYAKRERWGEIVKLFNEMRNWDDRFGEVTLIIVLTACGRLADIELGQWISEYIEANGLNRSVKLMTAVIDMYAKCGHVDKARRLFEQMDKKDVVAWSAMISGYSQARRCKEALDVFHDMQMANVEPNEVTMVSVLSCCAVLGALETGKWVHLYAKKKRLELTVTLGTALMDFYAKCGLIESAVEVFKKMPLKNVFSWTVLIQGLANNGQGKKALDFYYLMREKSIKPNDVTFIGVLSACSHVGMVDEGREFFVSMNRDFGIEPRVEHYGCLVDILGRAGLIEEAYQFIKNMPIPPNAVIWRTLLAACRAHKNVEVGEESLENLVQLEPMHSGDYILLSNIYASVDRWEDALRVRNEMREKGIKKTPGCSLIELDGEIYEFFAEDNGCPHSKEVYDATENMMRRIKSAGYVPNMADARVDAEEDDKEASVAHHSEKLAIAFSLIRTSPGTTIRISKNLRVCTDCHNATKIISEVFNREIVVRDRTRFHHFKEGSCSCNDYWSFPRVITYCHQ